MFGASSDGHQGPLLGLGHLDRAEARERTVDEEDLAR